MSTQDDMEGSAAPLIEHLTELRSRLIYSVAAFLVAMIICLFIAKPMLGFLLEPIENTMRALGDEQPVMQFTAPQELFFTYIRISVVGGLMLSFPVIAFQLWRFVAPGLYKKREKRLSSVHYSVSGIVLAWRCLCALYRRAARDDFLSWFCGPSVCICCLYGGHFCQ